MRSGFFCALRGAVLMAQPCLSPAFFFFFFTMAAQAPRSARALQPRQPISLGGL